MRQVFEAIHYLRNGKPQLRGSRFADAAMDIGMTSRSQSFKCAHLWSVDAGLVEWAYLEAKNSERRTGIARFPSIESILKRFPPPNKKPARTSDEKAEDEAVEVAARNRSAQIIASEELAVQDELTKAKHDRDESQKRAEDAERREAQRRRDRDNAERRAEEAERRAVTAELRLAELTKANNNSATPSTATVADDDEDTGEPLLPLVDGSQPIPDPTQSWPRLSVPIEQAQDNLMDSPIPPVGERFHDAPGFGGRPGKDDRELADLRAHVVAVCQQANVEWMAMDKKPKAWWREQVRARTVGEIHAAAYPANQESKSKPQQATEQDAQSTENGNPL